MAKKLVGALTERQATILILKLRGLSLRKIASLLGTSHQSVALTYRKALKNLRKALETVLFYKVASAEVRLTIPPGTRLVEIPKLLLDEADKLGVKVRADFTLVYKAVRYMAGECVRGTEVAEPILLLVDAEGRVEAYPLKKVAELVERVASTESFAAGLSRKNR